MVFVNYELKECVREGTAVTPSWPMKDNSGVRGCIYATQKEPEGDVRQTDRETDRQRDRQTDRQRDRQTERQTDRQRDRQTDRQTDR